MLFPDDRVLVFAPHPDDESLTIGALLIRAFASQLPLRVVYVTNGDNNPWAQRLCERRWRIGESDRLRWGERRKQEALAALASLGGDPNCASFLHLPDQGITKLLMGGDSKIMDLLGGVISSWNPSLVVQPAAEDAHPDHSALNVLLTAIQLACRESRLRILNYVVHPLKAVQPGNPLSTELTPVEVQRKLRAILCHRTQVAASRQRFTSYATAEEIYYDGSPAPFGNRPFSNTSISGNNLTLHLDAHDLRRSKVRLLMALQTAAGGPVRWTLTLDRRTKRAELRDELAASSPEPVEIRWNRSEVRVRLPKIPRLSCAFVKVCAPTLFFDRSGWTRVPVFQRGAKRLPGASVFVRGGVSVTPSITGYSQRDQKRPADDGLNSLAGIDLEP